jgi:hypothetical protein
MEAVQNFDFISKNFMWIEPVLIEIINFNL